tara:strand:+ start:171 stop:353 length:183 start_codon:yes stop_codon:yes gene_type:complete
MRLYLDFAEHDERSQTLALYDKDELGNGPLVVAPIEEWSEVSSDYYAIWQFKQRRSRFDE